MATLNIGGTKVKVDDAFLSLPPEQQAATVEEIAASLGGSQQSPAYTDALAAGSQASQRFANYDPNAPEPVGRPDLMGATAATLGGLVNGIPVVGPAIQNVSDAIVGTGAQLTGGDYGQTVQGLQARRAELAAANPIADIAGQVGGSIAGVGGLAAIPGGASALGLTGNLGARVFNGAVSSAGLEAADAAARGRDVTSAGLIGGALGGGIPLVGAGVSSVVKALGNSVGPVVQSAVDPVAEALRRTGVAVGRDRTLNPSMVMSGADEATARQAGIPLMNADRGGEVTRALARSVANQSPEARAVITRAADDRFTSQAPRAVEVIKRVAGGSVDDVGYQEALTSAARASNKPRYDAAFTSPNAQRVFTPETQELMQSPAIQRAIDMTQSRGKDMAAIAGQVPVTNPFRKGSDDIWRVVQKADGTFTVPNLAFWDQVKRNLDGMIGVAQRGGDKTETSILTQIKNKLVGSLDGAVPEYQAARQGAAAFFDAEDALDAGRKFANQPKSLPETQAAFAQFAPAEKEAFRTGYASELTDKIKTGGDRRNIIQQTFGTPAAREQNALVFGAEKARELEAYVRVEALADMLRGSLGNSTTARQLVEIGIGGGAGFALSGDWTGALTGAALAKGGRFVGEKVDARVMEEVARLLTSGNRADLDRAVTMAAKDPKWLQALEGLQNAIAAPSRGVALALASGGQGQ